MSFHQEGAAHSQVPIPQNAHQNEIPGPKQIEEEPQAEAEPQGA